MNIVVNYNQYHSGKNVEFLMWMKCKKKTYEHIKHLRYKDLTALEKTIQILIFATIACPLFQIQTTIMKSPLKTTV